jgi:hypothetical protein
VLSVSAFAIAIGGLDLEIFLSERFRGGETELFW